MRIALYQPEIAGNVGTILRTAACFAVPVDLIEPLGFAWGERALKRAGIDYADIAEVRRRADWKAFVDQAEGRLVLATTRGTTCLWDAAFTPGDVLLFGSEGAGVPQEVHARADLAVRIPIAAGTRSLNLAVSVGIVLAEAIRQTCPASA